MSNRELQKLRSNVLSSPKLVSCKASHVSNTHLKLSSSANVRSRVGGCITGNLCHKTMTNVGIFGSHFFELERRARRAGLQLRFEVHQDRQQPLETYAHAALTRRKREINKAGDTDSPMCLIGTTGCKPLDIQAAIDILAVLGRLAYKCFNGRALNNIEDRCFSLRVRNNPIAKLDGNKGVDSVFD